MGHDVTITINIKTRAIVVTDNNTGRMIQDGIRYTKVSPGGHLIQALTRMLEPHYEGRIGSGI